MVNRIATNKMGGATSTVFFTSINELPQIKAAPNSAALLNIIDLVSVFVCIPLV